METNNKPVVNLISKPENMLKTVYTACRTCYSADYPINIYNSTDDEEKMLKLIERVISSGHFSTIEHIQVSFAIDNVSRACTHQLVRHRHMSFSQKSQRYVKEKGQFDYLVPPTIEKNEELKKEGIEISDSTVYAICKKVYAIKGEKEPKVNNSKITEEVVSTFFSMVSTTSSCTF